MFDLALRGDLCDLASPVLGRHLHGSDLECVACPPVQGHVRLPLPTELYCPSSCCKLRNTEKLFKPCSEAKVAKRAPSALDYERIPGLQVRPEEDQGIVNLIEFH